MSASKPWPVVILRRLAAVLMPALLCVMGIIMFENKLLYFPAKYPAGFWEPELMGLRVEDYYFYSEDRTRLHAWYAPARQGRVTLLYCHGNAGNLSYAVDHIKGLVRLGVNVLIFDYRGYGRSQGKPDEAGLYKDANAAYQFLMHTGRGDPRQLIIYGQSLGGVVAAHLAARQKCAGLIVESSFTSAQDMARELYPWLPVRWLIKSRLDAAAAVGKVRAPVLVLHGTRDRTVPFRLGRRLFERAEEPKFFHGVENADHNDVYVVGGRSYYAKLEEFIFSLAIPLAMLEPSTQSSHGEYKDES